MASNNPGNPSIPGHLGQIQQGGYGLIQPPQPGQEQILGLQTPHHSQTSPHHSSIFVPHQASIQQQSMPEAFYLVNPSVNYQQISAPQFAGNAASQLVGNARYSPFHPNDQRGTQQSQGLSPIHFNFHRLRSPVKKGDNAWHLSVCFIGTLMA